MNQSTKPVVSVRLRFQSTPQESVTLPGLERTSPVGFFIDAKTDQALVEWLVSNLEPGSEISLYAWKSDSRRSRFFVIASHEAAVASALDSPQSKSAQTPFVAVIPMKMIGPNFWIPRSAQLQPSMRVVDWEVLIASDRIYAWHPSEGLGEFAAETCLDLSDLLILPDTTSGQWNAANERPSLPQHLISIHARRIESIDDWFSSAGGDIGKDAKKLAQSRPAPAELRGAPLRRAALLGKAGAASIVGKAGKAIAGAISAIRSAITGPPKRKSAMTSTRTPQPDRSIGNPGQGAWFGLMRKWIETQLQALDEHLEARRNAELHRLMTMLQSNPEEGLRYAIPFSDDESRGQATPGSSLTRRDLRWFGGGGTGPADGWNLDFQVRAKLTAKYRELALQEKLMGRFERAAYIYGKLLGDYQSAAVTLEEGRLYREAALVYLERQKNRIKAAVCYRKAGDFEDAIRLYREQGDYVESGNVFAELGRHEEAAVEFRLHVDDCIARHRWIDAADCLIEKLHATQEALELLQTQWPTGNDAEVCFRKSVDILDKSSQLDRISELITRLVSTTSVCVERDWPLNKLVWMVGHFKNTTLEAQARQQVLRLSVMNLETSTETGVDRALSALRQLEPGDIVLQRDTRRYQRDFSEKKRTAAKSTGLIPYSGSLSRLGKIESVFQTQLEADVVWRGLMVGSDGVLAVGEHDTDLVLEAIATYSLTQSPSHFVQRISNCLVPVPYRRWVRFSTQASHYPVNDNCVFVAGCKTQSDFEASRKLTKLMDFQIRLIEVSPIVSDVAPWPRTTDRTSEQCDYLRLNHGNWELRALRQQFASTHRFDLQDKFAKPISITDVDDWQMDDEAPSSREYQSIPKLALLQNSWCVGSDRELRIFNAAGVQHASHFRSAITDLIASPLHTRGRILVVTETQVVIQWLKKDGWAQSDLGQEFESPQVILMRDGHIAVAHGGGVCVYRLQGFQTRLVAKVDVAKAIQCISLDKSPKQFWTLDEAGELNCLKIVP
jgi:tetratricopeptide (TPR) repeat protein